VTPQSLWQLHPGGSQTGILKEIRINLLKRLKGALHLEDQSPAGSKSLITPGSLVGIPYKSPQSDLAWGICSDVFHSAHHFMQKTKQKTKQKKPQTKIPFCPPPQRRREARLSHNARGKKWKQGAGPGPRRAALKHKPCSKDSLLPSSSSSRDCEAPSVPGQPQHLPVGLAYMLTTGIASDICAPRQDPANSPGPFYPDLSHIPERCQWLQRVWSLLARVSASDFPVSAAVAVTSSWFSFTLPFLQIIYICKHKHRSASALLLWSSELLRKGTESKKPQGLEERQTQHWSGCPKVKHTYAFIGVRTDTSFIKSIYPLTQCCCGHAYHGLRRGWISSR